MTNRTAILSWGPLLPRQTRSLESGRSSAMSKRDEIEALFVRWGPMVMRHARSILGSEAEAEDATQDVFIKTMQSLDQFEGRNRISS